jgi:hypothetical protein
MNCLSTIRPVRPKVVRRHDPAGTKCRLDPKGFSQELVLHSPGVVFAPRFFTSALAGVLHGALCRRRPRLVRRPYAHERWHSLATDETTPPQRRSRAKQSRRSTSTLPEKGNPPSMMSWWESSLVQRQLHRQTEDRVEENHNSRHLAAIWQEMVFKQPNSRVRSYSEHQVLNR